MTQVISVALVGEFMPSFPPHAKTNEAIDQMRSLLGLRISAEWVSTCALETAVGSNPNFRELVLAAVAADVRRGGEKAPPTDPAVIFADMLQRLETDPLWAREYEDFVRQVSFAARDEMIGFIGALASCRRLVQIN